MLGSDSKLYVPATALATTTKIGSINKLTGNTTDFLDGTNTFQPLAPAVQPTIWSARLRSFNAIGNPTFDVDQISVSVISAQTGGKTIDRWTASKTGTMAISAGRANSAAGDEVLVPGTNFRISSGYHRIQLTTAQATLAAGDLLYMQQIVEGQRFRELSMDVHSQQILVRSSVANLKFSVALRDNVPSKSLVKLCTLGAANTWTLIQLPNLPLWSLSGGTFSALPGAIGYYLAICLAAGTTWTAPAADTWQNGSFLAAPGMSNFAASAVNSTFDIAFVQHEPGALCTTPIDCPFTQNYDDCLRYYAKSYEYGVKAPTNTSVGVVSAMVGANANYALGTIPFAKTMAKIPALTVYAVDGTANACLQLGQPGNAGVNSILGLGSKGFYGVGFPSAVVGNQPVQMQYQADTGW